MPKSKKMKTSQNGTKKRVSAFRTNFSSFQKEITVKFLEMIIMVKLYHWKTYRYSTHIATDELYTSLNEHMDKFIEILLGKSGERTDLMNTTKISLVDNNSFLKFKERLSSFKTYLVNLNRNKAMMMMSNSDLLNIRDEILGDINKILYLLTFK